MKTHIGLFAVVSLMSVAIAPVVAQTPAGEAFTANTTTLGEQSHPDVAVGPDHSFVVVWQSENQDGDGWGVFARWFDWRGEEMTGEVPVNTYTLGDQVRPRIDGDDLGRFVIVWEDSGRGIVARRFDGSGLPLGGEIEVAVPGPGPADQAVSVNGDGYFAVSWLLPATSNRDVQVRRFAPDGLPIETAILVSTFPYFVPRDGTAVELLDDRSFLVVWSDAEEVFARHYASHGGPTAGQFQVSQLGPFSSFSVGVDAGSDDLGRFRMVWSTDVNLLEGTTLTRTVTGEGTLGALTDLALPTVQWPEPGFSMTGNGEFVVTHVPYYPRDLEGTRFSQDHDAMENFVIADGLGYDEPCRGKLAHEGSDAHEFVVVWQEPPESSSNPDIWARIFSNAVFNDGFETGNTSAWAVTLPAR